MARGLRPVWKTRAGSGDNGREGSGGEAGDGGARFFAGADESPCVARPQPFRQPLTLREKTLGEQGGGGDGLRGEAEDHGGGGAGAEDAALGDALGVVEPELDEGEAFGEPLQGLVMGDGFAAETGEEVAQEAVFVIGEPEGVTWGLSAAAGGDAEVEDGVGEGATGADVVGFFVGAEPEG